MMEIGLWIGVGTAVVAALVIAWLVYHDGQN
jgi:uncharacterized membrane protein YukC